MPAPSNSAPARQALVVDDDPQMRRLVVRSLRGLRIETVEAASVAEARAALDSHAVDLVVTDLRMPGGCGTQLLGNPPPGRHPPAVVVITGVDDLDEARIALEYGVLGYLVKPFTGRALAITVLNALRVHDLETAQNQTRELLEQLVLQRTGDLERTLEALAASERQAKEAARDAALAHEEAIWVLARALEGWNLETATHVQRVGEFSRLLALAIGRPLQEAERIARAAGLHDVGKICVPDTILAKPGPLTDAERRKMQLHCETGHDILRGTRNPVLQLAAEIALAHHERWDGGGYPRGLAREAIPLAARIVAIADTFDALTSDRPYRSALGVPEAKEIVRAERGRQFDPRLVDAFLALDELRDDSGAIAGVPPARLFGDGRPGATSEAP